MTGFGYYSYDYSGPFGNIEVNSGSGRFGGQSQAYYNYFG